MALISEPFEAGDLRGTKHTLEKAGDVFPVHAHGESDVHISVVARGSLRCIGRAAIEGEIIKAGDVIDWNAGEPHGFVALDDGSVLVNVIKRMAQRRRRKK